MADTFREAAPGTGDRPQAGNRGPRSAAVTTAVPAPIRAWVIFMRGQKLLIHVRRRTCRAVKNFIEKRPFPFSRAEGFPVVYFMIGEIIDPE
ncbi:MAG: hypothetical protein LKG81_04065 [Acetobacter peroxydans]|nr:hypothetical protein [Acetobacter peroxydans]